MAPSPDREREARTGEHGSVDEGWARRTAGLGVVALPGGLRVAEAVRFGERRRGLAGLDAMPADAGLRIHRCRSIHTVGMRFALDLVWLDRAGAVVRVDRDVGPWRLRSCRRARSVIEVAAGHGDAVAKRWMEAVGERSP